MDDLEESTVERDLSAVARLLAAHQLPSPSEVFLKQLTNEVNKDHVVKMMDSQRHMLQRFEKTNEMLCTFNTISATRYETTIKEFMRHTQLMTDMKKDLDSVFRRIRVIKENLSKQHPAAFKAASDMHRNILDEEEEGVDGDVDVLDESEEEDYSPNKLPYLGDQSRDPADTGKREAEQSAIETRARDAKGSESEAKGSKDARPKINAKTKGGRGSDGVKAGKARQADAIPYIPPPPRPTCSDAHTASPAESLAKRRARGRAPPLQAGPAGGRPPPPQGGPAGGRPPPPQAGPARGRPPPPQAGPTGGRPPPLQAGPAGGPASSGTRGRPTSRGGAEEYTATGGQADKGKT